MAMTPETPEPATPEPDRSIAEPRPAEFGGTEPGLAEIVVKDGPGGVRGKRFVGRRVAAIREFDKSGVEVVKVFRSRTGKFVVQRQRSDWSDLASTAGYALDHKGWLGLLGIGEGTWGDYTVTVVETLDEVRDLVSAKLYRRIAAEVEQPRVEYLDI
jgi:EXLDI family protein